jgi:hypothetical protein
LPPWDRGLSPASGAALAEAQAYKACYEATKTYILS